MADTRPFIRNAYDTQDTATVDARVMSLAGTGAAGAALALAQSAYSLAAVGTNVGTNALQAAGAAQATADSALSGVNGVFQIAVAGTNLAQSAYNLAAVGTNVGTNALQSAAAAQATANSAISGVNSVYPIAIAGTNLAQAAYSLASIGTNTGTNAYVLASQALSVSQSGTASAQAAYNLAAIGTNVGTNAFNLASSAKSGADTAFALAVTGTNATQAAYNLAAIGTNTGTNALVAAAAAQFTADSAVSGVNGVFVIAVAGTNLAQSAYSLASIGTNVGTNALQAASAAQSTANSAISGVSSVYQIAIAGTNLAQSAYNLAAIGTNTGTNALNAAAAAQATANSALSGVNSVYTIAVAGTSLAQSAYNLAAIGTNVGTNAYVLAQNGSALAWQANVIAQQGTNLVFIDPLTKSNGTVAITGTVQPVNGGTGSGNVFTTGAVVFAGASGKYTQDPSNFFWDAGNQRLGIRAGSSPLIPFQLNTSSISSAFTSGGYQMVIGNSDQTGQIGILSAASGGNSIIKTRFENLSILAGVNDSNLRSLFLGSGDTYLALQITTRAGLPYTSATGRLGLNATGDAQLHIGAGTINANTAPLKFNSGPLNTIAETGAVEFLTDKLYFTITTGAARKEIALNDTALTSGRVPFSTTNGRLTDSSSLLFAGNLLTTGSLLATDSIGSLNNITSGGIITSTTAGANGLVTATSSGMACSLTAGLFNSAFLFDQSGGFTIQAVTRAAVTSGNAPGGANIKFYVSNAGKCRVNAQSGAATNSLDVNGNTAIGSGYIGSSAPTDGLIVQGLAGFGLTGPTARIHLAAGTLTASSAPLKFTSGPLLTSSETGAVEFLTDKLYFTITTGAARKEFTLNDTALTSGRVPFSTTNGRLTDSSALTFNSVIPQLTVGCDLFVSGIAYFSAGNTSVDLSGVAIFEAVQTNTLEARTAPAIGLVSNLQFSTGMDGNIFNSTGASYLRLYNDNVIELVNTNDIRIHNDNCMLNLDGAGPPKLQALSGGFVTGELTVANTFISVNKSFILTAGQAASGSAPLKFASGTNMTVPEVGAMEFATDSLYFTITTGAARKQVVLADTALTSGRVPFSTTNGRLTDSSSFAVSNGTVTVTSVQAQGMKLELAPLPALIYANASGTVASASVTYPIQFSTGNLSIDTTAFPSLALANQAYSLACIGTNVGTNAYNLASSAKSGADSVYAIAVAGTNAAAAAQATANSALSGVNSVYPIAVTGTNLAQSAYNLASIGTNVGTNAYNLASNGSALAWEALVIAQQGTNTVFVSPLSRANGTVAITGIVSPANGGTGNSALTPASVPYITTGGVFTEDTTRFVWDATNYRLGVGVSSPSATLSLSGTTGNILSLRNPNIADGMTVLHSFGTDPINPTYSALFIDPTGNHQIYWGYNARMYNPSFYVNNALLVNSVQTNGGGITLVQNGASWSMYAPTNAKFRIGGASATPTNFFWTGNYSPSGQDPANLFVVPTGTGGISLATRAVAGQTGNQQQWQDSGSNVISAVDSAGKFGIKTASASPTAYLHLGAGTSSASSAPLKFTSGVNLSSPEAGAMEFTTDSLYFTITTGAARKEIVLADATLTSGRVPYVTTNGRLVDSANLNYDSGAARLSVGSTNFSDKISAFGANSSIGAINAANNRATRIGLVTSTNSFTTGSVVDDGILASSNGSLIFIAGQAVMKYSSTGKISWCNNGGSVPSLATAWIQLPAGTATAGFAPLKFSAGALLATPEAGAVEFLTDKAYLTITTGAARKEFTLNDITLTSGRVPFTTTDGRLTDSSSLLFASSTLAVSGTVQVTSTIGPQLLLNYDASNFLETKIGSTGAPVFRINASDTANKPFTFQGGHIKIKAGEVINKVVFTNLAEDTTCSLEFLENPGNPALLQFNGAQYRVGGNFYVSGEALVDGYVRTAAGFGGPPIIAETGNRTLVSTDEGKYIRYSSASDGTMTVPSGIVTGGGYPASAAIYFEQVSTGKVIVVPDTGVTVVSSKSAKTRTQYAVINIRQVDTDVWVVDGDRE